MKYAIFYPEDEGYLYVRTLGEGRWGEGFQGIATAVCSTKGELFVRKLIIPAADIWSNIEGIPEIIVGAQLNHRLVPKLVSNTSYNVLKDTHKDSGKVHLDTMIFEFINGGTLGDLLENIPFDADTNPEMSNIFAWSLFQDALEAITYVHGQNWSHQDGHPGNYFLRYDAKSKLPQCMLGDYGGSYNLIDLDRDQLKPEEIAKLQEKINTGELTGTLEEEVGKEIEDRHSQVTRQLGIDLDYTSESIAQIITGMTNVCSELQMHKMQQLLTDPAGFDPELIEAWHRLNTIIDDLYKGDRTSYYTQLGHLKEAVTNFAEHRIASCRDYSWTQPSPLAAKPRLFDTRQDLLNSCGTIPGPFRIARIHPETLQVVAVEITKLNLHVPPISTFREDFDENPDLNNPEHLIPTVDKNGKDQIIKAADIMQAESDNPKDAGVAALFQVDTKWQFEQPRQTSTGTQGLSDWKTTK